MTENVEDGSVWLPLKVKWLPFSRCAKEDASIIG
jgi:hypothetical protein